MGQIVRMGETTGQNPECERSTHARLIAAHSGEVNTDPRDKSHGRYIGAQAHTNNTGELTALHLALTRALARPAGRGKEDIWSDSLYAINMTNGMWTQKRKRNREIIARTRALWRRLIRQRPGEVRLRHVRSHIRVPGNELADWLAEVGRVTGRGTTAVQAGCWLRRWMASPPNTNTIGDPAGVG